MSDFVVCVRNEGYEVALELRKIYQAVPDAGAARHHLIRVVDESGERVAQTCFPRSAAVPSSTDQKAQT
jgi:hypothetical protein